MGPEQTNLSAHFAGNTISLQVLTAISEVEEWVEALLLSLQ